MDRRKIDVAVASALIVVSLIILTSDSLVEGGMETELGSMFLPRIVAVFIILFSATIGIKALVKLGKGVGPEGPEHIPTDGFLGVNIYIAVFIAYWLVVPHVGFLVATPIAMFSIAFLLGGRNWFTMAAVSIITPVIIYYGCSQFLRVFLPDWTWT